MGDTALLTLGAGAEAGGAGKHEMPLSRSFPRAAVIPYSEIVASCTKSIGLWWSPMDIASETTNAAFHVPIPAQFLSLYFQLQGKPGPAPHLPVRNPFHQTARLCHCCCRAGLHHTQRRKGEESRRQSLLKMFECAWGWFYL